MIVTLAVTILLLLIPQTPASGDKPTPTPTPTASPRIDQVIDPDLISHIRLNNVWKCGSSVNECLYKESDVFVLTRVAMGEAPDSFGDRYFIMWNIKMRAALGFKRAGFYSGYRDIPDRWGPETSIKVEALCIGGCQYAPVRASENIYFPCGLSTNSPLRAMLCPTDDQILDWYFTYKAATFIVDADISEMPEELKGFDGFRSPSVTWIDTIDRPDGLRSRQFFQGGNIWRDEYEKDNVFWNSGERLPTLTPRPSSTIVDLSIATGTNTPILTLTPLPKATKRANVPTERPAQTHKESDMDQLPELVVAGIPLIIIIFAIVEEIKAYGVTGKILRFVSVLVGFLLAVAVSLGEGLPVDPAGWVTLIVIGVVYGLTASGAYDFLNSRLKRV